MARGIIAQSNAGGGGSAGVSSLNGETGDVTITSSGGTIVVTTPTADTVNLEASGGSSVSFQAITSGTNTAAAMAVGSGATLAASGTGTIAATSAPASGITGTTLASNVVTSSLTSVGTLASLNVTGNINNTALSASELTATDGSKNLQSLDTATYPSLTEVSYVKGVTSAIQTQLNTKGSGTLTAVSVVTANGVSGSSSGGATPALTIALGAITPSSVNAVTISGSGSPSLAVTGASTISGSNTGDQTITLTGAVTGSGTGSFATTIATPGTLTVASSNSTATAHTHAITSSSAPGAAASILATDASGIIGTTGSRIVKGWFTDITATNAISGSVTGNAGTVTTNANLTGAVTSAGNATTLVQSLVMAMPTVANTTGNNIALDAKASFGYTINQIRGLTTSSGTCTVAIQINGTNVTSLSALSVTSTPQDVTATGANTVAAGDRISVVITSNSSGLNLEFTLKITRT